jgi:hypothetical protein
MTTKSVPRKSRAFSVQDTLFILSQDLRTSWDEPEDPRQVAAWRAWWAMERADREILPAIRAIGRAVPPVLRDADD